MAFCAYCGKQIADGTVCSCQQQATPNQQQGTNNQGQPQPQGYYQNVNQVYGQTSEQARQASAAATQAAGQYASQAGSVLNETLGHILLILKAPADAAKSFVVAANLKASCVLILIQGILSGLFSLCVVSKLNTYIEMAFKGNEDLPVSMFSSGNSFFYTLLMSVVFSIVFMLLAWAVAAISKGKTTYQQMLSVAAVRSSYLMPVAVLSILVFFIKPVYGVLLFYVAGVLMSCIALVEALRVIPEINENIKTYLITIAMIIFIVIVLYFTIKVSPKAISSYYADDFNDFLEEFGELMKKAKTIGFYDLFDDVTDGLYYSIMR
jgi:hypothetical protein